MNTIVLERPRELTRVETPEPVEPGAGEALIRVHRVGVCGTDIASYLGEFPFFRYPAIPGHELGVEVISVGERVTDVTAGERCAVEPYLTCGTCVACSAGRSNCCETLQCLGVHTDGGLRPLMTLPSRLLHPSEQLSFDQLALVETLCIGRHAVNRAMVRSGERVLVIGAGPIGLSVIASALSDGASVEVSERSASRLAFCEKNTSAKAAEEGGRFPVVFDATGNAESMSNAWEWAEHGGRVVYVGVTRADVRIPDPELHRRELTLLASRNAVGGEFRQVIAAIENGSIDTRPWVTHRCSMADLPDEFESFTRPESGVVKAMVDVPG